MNRLDELIRKLCPDGVPYRTLGEMGTFYNGLSGKTKEDFREGNATFITYMNVYSNMELKTDVTEKVRIGENEKQNIVQYGDIIFTGSSETLDECGMSSVVTAKTDAKLYLNSFCFGYRFNESSCFIPAFTKHLFRSNELRRQIIRTASGVTRFNVSKKKMENVKLPVPPLEVQREIVRVLDNFTFLTAELTAELTARRKQYEYYRNRLFIFDDETENKILELGSMAKVTKLAGFEFTNYVKYSNEGKVIALRGLNVKDGRLVLNDVKYIDKSDFSKLKRSKLRIDDMLFTYVGTVGQVALIDKNDKYYLAPNVALIRIENKNIIPKFLMYYFQTTIFKEKEINRLQQSSSMKNIPMEKIRRFKVPVPSLETQKRVITFLDNFDAVCNDISIGLPAEIAARQKQYEYYRDKLLTFKELNA